MSKSILLITSFAYPGKRDEHFDLPEGMENVGDLLVYLGGVLRYGLLNAGGDDIDQDLQVVINGKPLWSYPEGLKTHLRHGDTVQVQMITLGGG